MTRCRWLTKYTLSHEACERALGLQLPSKTSCQEALEAVTRFRSLATPLRLLANHCELLQPAQALAVQPLQPKLACPLAEEVEVASRQKLCSPVRPLLLVPQPLWWRRPSS